MSNRWKKSYYQEKKNREDDNEKINISTCFKRDYFHVLVAKYAFMSGCTTRVKDTVQLGESWATGGY